jgi:hypothetical protein
MTDALADHRPRATGTAAPAALLVLALAGCATPEPGQDDLVTKVGAYYAMHAVEEEGRCPSPKMDSIVRRKVLASRSDQTILHVRYAYYDPSHDEAGDLSQLFVTDKACTGIAERDFTLVPTPLGYQVRDMSGPRREAP